MKILLVYPSTLDGQNRLIKYREAWTPPLSLAIIAALTPRRHTVRVVNDLVETIDFGENWDLVGVTATTAQAERAYQIADEFRRRGAKVVMGGIHPSTLPHEALQHADAVAIGEAEGIWLSILADRECGKLKDFYWNVTLPDLKEAVVPRWECFNMQVYRHRWYRKYPMMPVCTTRGCPYGCRFCAVTRFWGKTYRTRPISSVLTEIRHTGAREFFFVDDNIAANPDYARELFGALEGDGLLWMSQASTTILRNPDLLDRAAKAGCFALFIGMESLNEESLASARKGFNKVERYEELLQRMHSAGITPILSFIFGFDQDREDQFEATVNFLKRNRVGSAVFWILTPSPGTELYDELQRDGRITTTSWSQYDGSHVVFSPKTWSPAELSDRYWDTYLRVYRPPRMFSNILWNTRYSRRRWEAFLRNCFAQSFSCAKLRAREHPYSGGSGRLGNSEAEPVVNGVRSPICS